MLQMGARGHFPNEAQASFDGSSHRSPIGFLVLAPGANPPTLAPGFCVMVLTTEDVVVFTSVTDPADTFAVIGLVDVVPAVFQHRG